MPANTRPGRALERYTRRFAAGLQSVRAALVVNTATGDPATRQRAAALALCRLMCEFFLEQARDSLPPPDLDPAAVRAARACFTRFRWRLDGGPGLALTPDALGYLFERSLDRKRVGAFYTQADVASYIACATVLPRVLDRAALLQPQTFGPGGSAWRLLRERPERYIHADMRHGASCPLPPEVAAGLADVARRAAWDSPAPATHALPGETWREALARRARCAAARQLLRRGQVRTPADLITHNLDILRFALDAAAACESPADLRALWGALRGLTVLDPTCGAGAFLLAAARVLEPLYHACLGRMDTLAHGDADLQRALEEADRPPGRRANVLATILADNLYGVDILPEAVEVCRMRLALEYAARLQPPPAHQRDEAEPGPKGCSHAAAIASEAAERCSNPAPAHESGAGGEGLPAREAALVSRAMKLPHLHAGDALDAELWPTAFPRVMQEGGFDAVIGNPPYVALAGTRAMYAARGYTTAAGGNLYALVVERALALLRSGGRLGVIVPLAAVSTGGMAALQALYAPHEQWHSHFAVRPARLFDGVDMNLTISLLRKAQGACHTTGYRRWSDGALSERPHLFTTLAYTRNPRLPTHANPFPKLGSPLEARILERMLAHGRRLGDYVTPGGITLYYHSGGRYWRKALTTKLSSHYKPITVAPEHAPAVFGLLNSQLFYWYWIGNSNCMDVVSREVLGLPVFALERADRGAFAELMEELLAAYAGARRTRARRGARIRVDEANFEVARARPVIDAIDGLLARCYGLDEEELDFIRSYDLKHRARGGS